MSPDFFTRLERQLLEAAERDITASPRRRRLAAWGVRLAPRRALAAVPIAGAVVVMGVVAALILSLGGESSSPTRPGAPKLPAPTATAGIAPPVPSPGRAPDSTGPSVFLLNATSKNGIAARAAKRLEQLGARIEGAGNGPENTIVRSIVYANPASRGTLIAQQLGIIRASSELPPNLRALAPGADVVVLLGADFAERRDRRLDLTGADGARGVVLLPALGGFSLTGSGLPPSNRYRVWGENAVGDAVPIGFASYDRKGRSITGSVEVLPPTLALQPPRRLFVTRESTRNPRTPGRVVLDTGRIRG